MITGEQKWVWGDIIESGGGFPVPHFHTNENEEYRATAPILPPGFANCGIAPEQRTHRLMAAPLNPAQ